ncbi:SPOR domain-containing protein [Paraburkholderia phosphatilytica]|uniref:SPOR domain-containing protein n=1 Tax=Paraburkholderia phosphatilytica TaxID=2282883 RepID=UPI000E4FCEEE|nr:SPOR domain-containing protein [Paraburkholderia phosphatilytica]
MGIFSFGNGKQEDAPARRGSGRNTRNPRVERRSRRTTQAGDAEAMLLDPTLPEKQRARRRLVGAIALVVAAIVILPMLLDSHPKPVTDDIAIDIPNRPVAKVTTPPQDTQAGVAPDSPSAGAGLAASGLAAATAGTAAQSAATASQAGTQSATKSPSKPAASQQTQSTAMNPAPPATSPSKPAKPSAAPTQSTESTARTAAAANADSGTPAAPAGARFALQLGVFPDDASAKAWATKLKAAGVPAYTERRKQTDGTTQTLLRAGPFPDRAAASAAIAKVRSAGLSSSANSGAAQ